MNKLIKLKRLELDKLKDSYILNNPAQMYQNKEQKLMMMMDKINTLVTHSINNKRVCLDNIMSNHIFVNPKDLYKEKTIKLSHIIEKLELINPLGVLKRGYSLTYKEDIIVNSVKKIKKYDVLKVKFSDGVVSTKVIDKE